MKNLMGKSSYITNRVDCSVDISMSSGENNVSKEFVSSSSTSFSVDETASNSSFSSSYFSFASAFSSTYQTASTPKSMLPVGVGSPYSLASLSKSKVPNNSLGNDDLQRRMPSQILLAIMSLNRDQVVWEEMEDDLYILLDGALGRLRICKHFYFQSVLSPRKKCALLRSLAYLLSSKAVDIVMHDEHMSRVACFLSTGRDSQPTKLAALKTLHMCLLMPSSLPSLNIINKHEMKIDAVETLIFNFLTERTKEWDPIGYQSAAMTLLYEIRAKCLRELDLEQERIRRVVDNGEITAVIIATGAKLVEFGIQESNKAIEGQINKAGNKMKSWIDAEDRQVVDRNAVVVRAFSGSTKRASEYARKSTKLAAQSTLDATLSGFYTIGNKFEEGGLTEKLSPEGREIIKAGGKVCMASVGAVVLISEAMVGISRSASAKATEVAVDIVSQKYGPVAGEVAQDASDTCTNMLETMGNVTLVGNGSKLAKTAAKNAGKKQIDDDAEKAKKIIMNLERQGAVMAKQALGIQWEGNWTKELCASDANTRTINETHQQPQNIMPFGKNEIPITKPTLISTNIKSNEAMKPLGRKEKPNSINTGSTTEERYSSMVGSSSYGSRVALVSLV
mmetsp:Transcript_4985/g.5524  ORF Transcript_4985/g.5524 Transcript_4985/m.5524 type:complete len:620 (-) Transcript_4985:66-1925(-)